MNLHFEECRTCREKPGSPALCEGCLHNRWAIDKLSNLLKKKNEKLDILRKVLEL